MSPDALAAALPVGTAPSSGLAAAPARHFAASAAAGGELGRVEAPAAAGGEFGRLVTQGIGEVNGQLLASQGDLQRLATGDVQNLHQVMVRLEESRLSFELLLQVRNRLLEAYQDVMKMQV
jgi:flagellar hook-basal body complex protein FliE